MEVYRIMVLKYAENMPYFGFTLNYNLMKNLDSMRVFGFS